MHTAALIAGLACACGASRSTERAGQPAQASEPKLVLTKHDGREEELGLDADGTIRSSVHNEGVTGALGAVPIQFTERGDLTYNGEAIASLRDDGEIVFDEKWPRPTRGLRVREDGALLRDGKVVAEFDARGVLITKVDHDNARVVVHGDRASRRKLMVLWAITIDDFEPASAVTVDK